MEDTLAQFKTLVEIVARLRGQDGCPWDREQTQKTLTQYAIEEAFELVEAIESGCQSDIQEELGDFLFQVILQAQVAQDEGHFQLNDVLKQVNEKLVQRHPHVFGNMKLQNSEEVWRNWHRQKESEGENKKKSVFSYPRNLPALQASHKIGRKTQGYRFDWENWTQVLAKVKEELQETEEALASDNQEHIQHEIGDLLFSVAQLARHKNLDPEACLRQANRRFERRFLHVLAQFNGSREDFAKLPAEEMERLWKEAKKHDQGL